MPRVSDRSLSLLLLLLFLVLLLPQTLSVLQVVGHRFRRRVARKLGYLLETKARLDGIKSLGWTRHLRSPPLLRLRCLRCFLNLTSTRGGWSGYRRL